MKYQVSVIEGYESLRALNAFSALLLGLKMLPAYMSIPYEEFYSDFKNKTDAQKETLIREAVVFVELTQAEVEALVTFCKDSNGVPFHASNLKRLPLKEIHEIITAVCCEIGKINIDILSAEEKKNSLTSQ